MVEFTNTMQQAGIAPPANISADGILHRFHIEGDKPHSKNGWYVLFDDGVQAGSFGCWKRGIQETWSQKEYKAFTPEEKARYRANMEALKRQKEAEQKRIHAECREVSEAIWKKSQPAPKTHPYILRKGLKDNYGVREYKGSLVVPVRDGEGIGITPRLRVGGKVCYPKDAAIAWLKQRCEVLQEEGGGS